MKTVKTSETICDGNSQTIYSDQEEEFLSWCEQMMKERAEIEIYQNFKDLFESSILTHRIRCGEGCEASVFRTAAKQDAEN